ncbi:hypothetical protein M0R45_004769 [Rubus argutus]|uniref:PGG domain-containing protein n=1 Tax=Rubus argutus TaxID=59490 RepID=A0AAW1YKN6_RUBAR
MDPVLYEAATSGNVDFLKNIRDGDILFQKTPKNNNVLHIAAQFKQTVFFKEFPTHDIPSPLLFWATNNKGDTPMHVAARVGCDELVGFLIDHAKKLLNIEATDLETGPTDAEAYKELLRRTNLEKDTALHVAVKCGHRNVVILLVDADPELCGFTNNANESPLFLAISKGFPNIASYILDKSPASLSFEGINGVTALHAAVTRNLTCKDIVEIMVSKNPEIIGEVDELGWTPLHYAAFNGNVKAITSLIKQNSSVAYVLDKFGMSALHVAAYAGHIKVMKELIRLRPDTCDLLNHKGQTVLHAAVLADNLLAIRYILKTPELAGLVNEADNDGNTPLHVAVFKQSTSVMKVLARDRKVDKTATNNHHSKAADIFVGDNLEPVQFSGRPILPLLGGSIGVPFFQRFVRRDFTKLESPEEKVASSTLSKQFDTNLLVVMLIATVTFAAALTMPGGFNSDGMAILHRRIFFFVFVLFDTISFILSMFVVFVHFMMPPVSRRNASTRPGFIYCSIVAMVVAFGSGVIVVLPNHSPLGILVILICSTSCFLIIIGVKLAKPVAARGIRPTRNWLRHQVI